MGLGIKNREQLTGTILDEFESCYSTLRGLLLGPSGQHNEDGTHQTVTAASIASTAGYKEHARPAAMGEWTDVSWVAADAGQFTINASSNVRQYRYMRIGKTVWLNVDISGIVANTASASLTLKLPVALQPRRVNANGDDCRWSGAAKFYVSAGVSDGWMYVESGLTTLSFFLADLGNFPANGFFGVVGSIMYEMDDA